MGIRGLLQFLEEYSSNVFVEQIPIESNLLIDGCGWAFHMLLNHANLCPREFGGSYGAFDAIVRNEVLVLIKEYGFKMTVYFDGKISRMKSETIKKRTEKDEESWMKLLEYCENGSSCKNDNFPMPPFYIDQLKSSLQSLDIAIVTFEDEADQEIAKLCTYYNAINADERATEYYVYANDRYMHDSYHIIDLSRINFCFKFSDYLLMKNCPYIKFGSFIPMMSTSTQNTSTSSNTVIAQITAMVWRREELAQELDLSEFQLIEFALLIGNDFTDVFSRDTFHQITGSADLTSPLTTFPSGYSPATIHSLLEFIRSQPEDYRLSSMDPALQQAIEFSRALYNLQDISAYPEDPRHTRTMSLSDAQKQSIETFLTNNVVNKANKRGYNIGEVTVTYLQRTRLSDLNLYKMSAEIIDTLNMHLQAIQLPTTVYSTHNYRNKNGRSNNTSGDISEQDRSLTLAHPPVWDDVEAAMKYQLICKEVKRYLESRNAGSRDKSPLNVS